MHLNPLYMTEGEIIQEIGKFDSHRRIRYLLPVIMLHLIQLESARQNERKLKKHFRNKNCCEFENGGKELACEAIKKYHCRDKGLQISRTG